MPDSATQETFVRLRALHDQGRFLAALNAVEPLCEKYPGHVPLIALRVSCLLNLVRPAEAARIARRALRNARAPSQRSTLAAMLIDAYAHDRRPDQAAQTAREELAMRPEDTLVLAAQTRALLLDSQRTNAIQNILPFINHGPVSATVASAFVAAARRTDHASQAQDYARRALEQDSDAPAQTRASVHAQLALMLDEQGRYDEAFTHAELAADHLAVQYNDEAVASRVRRLRAVYTPDSLAKAPLIPPPPETPRPVFIVGMPRSGTTLTERIIAAHPDTAGAGELSDLSRVITNLVGTTDTPTAPEQVIAEAAAEYRQSLAQATGNTTPAIITDKMPTNFWHLGFIAHAMPDALVIHCRRDPVDTCLSCFLQPLSAAYPFASNLTDCATYFRHYLDVMAHFRTLMAPPGTNPRILEVDLERTVADPDTEIRRMLDFIGLDFHPACLRPHEAPNTANTLSNDQIKRGIYATATPRRIPYAAHTEPLLEALGDAAHPLVD